MNTALPKWLDGLSHGDWLYDGRPCSAAQWARLDWSGAWVDIGPSPTGNPGPYWHVPLLDDDDETVHRLYPKVLKSKWLAVIQQAMIEHANKRCSGS